MKMLDCSSEKFGISRLLRIRHVTGTLITATTRNLELCESCMPYMACNKNAQQATGYAAETI
jgi:hypothetical protein